MSKKSLFIGILGAIGLTSCAARMGYKKGRKDCAKDLTEGMKNIYIETLEKEINKKDKAE